MVNQLALYIGAHIKQGRLEAGLTQGELGHQLGHKNGAYVSRWEAGERTPGCENLDRLCHIFNKPHVWFFPREGLTDTQEDDNLPSLINIIERKLNNAKDLYEVISHQAQLVEIPIMSLKSIEKPFTIPIGAKYIKIPKSELAQLDDASYKDIFAIYTTTDLGNDFGIFKSDYVIIKYNPPKVDGDLYLIRHQNKMLFRYIGWEPLILIDALGVKTHISESDIILSGQVLLIWNRRKPRRIII